MLHQKLNVKFKTKLIIRKCF